MARINYPTDIKEQTVLLDNIKTKVDADGKDSPISAMLISKGIDLDDDIAIGKIALEKNSLCLVYEKSSHLICQKRNKLIKPIMKHTRGIFQFLKKLFTPNFKVVGEWGGVISNSGKIKYPKSAREKMKMIISINKKNDSYDKTPSPLLPFLIQNKLDLDTEVINAEKVIALDEELFFANSNSNIAREERDHIWAKPLLHLHDIGNFLKSLFRDDSQELGVYGYVVVEDKKVEKERTVSIAWGTNKLGFRARVGSIIQNTGTTDLKVYKGKGILGTTILLKANSEMILSKGYSIFSVKNLSPTDFGQFTYFPL